MKTAARNDGAGVVVEAHDPCTHAFPGLGLNRTLQVPHAPQSNTKHTTPTEERGPVRVQKGPRTDSQGKVSKASEDQMCAARERTGAVGRRRGCHDPCTRNPSRGSMQEEKRTCERRGRHLLRNMVVTDDVSQLPMSSLNKLALPVYPYRK